MLNETEERNLDSDLLTPVAKLLCSKVAHYSDKKVQSPKTKVQRYPQITQITRIKSRKAAAVNRWQANHS